MNTEALFLFLILLLGLILCSFLGGNCGKENFTGQFAKEDNNMGNNFARNNDNLNNNYPNNSPNTNSNVSYDNYNHYNGSGSELTSGSTFNGENGGSIVVNTNSDGTQSLQVTFGSNDSPITFTSKNPERKDSFTTIENYTNYYNSNGSITTFYGPNGEVATVVKTSDGKKMIRVKTRNGTYTYTSSGSYYNPNNTSSTKYYGSTGYQVQTYDGAYGGSAGSVTGPMGNTAYYAQGPNGNTVAGSTSNTYPYNNNTSSSQYYGPYGGSAGSVTGPQGNTAYYAQGPNGNTVAGTTAGGSDYYNTLPPGVPASQIQPGQEDLYILKSQVVPPVCPACTAASTIPRQEPCPACPACSRCPEPSFECKKVPNYNAIGNNELPVPVLNDFSTFGM